MLPTIEIPKEDGWTYVYIKPYFTLPGEQPLSMSMYRKRTPTKEFFPLPGEPVKEYTPPKRKQPEQLPLPNGKKYFAIPGKDF
jgi:hypothetical protein